MSDETFATGRWHGLSGEPGVPSSESNDSAVNDSVSIHLLDPAGQRARDRVNIELLELIAKDPLAFILEQGWASVSLDVSRGLMELLFWKMV